MKVAVTSLLAVVAILSSSAHSQCMCSSQGDVDGSGSIDVADINYTVWYFFMGGLPPVSDLNCPAPSRQDLNCDYAIDVADLTCQVAYMFLGGPPPCDLCEIMDAPPGDPVDPLYLLWLADNYHAIIYETGPSDFLYLNGTGLTQYDSVTSTDATGDTITTDVLVRHTNDSAHIRQVLPFPGVAGRQGLHLEEKPGEAGQWIKSRDDGNTTFKPSSCQQDGADVGNSDVVINGNTISFQGIEVDMGDPTPFGPPDLYKQAWDVMVADVPMPTPEEIQRACDSGYVNTANFRIHATLKSESSAAVTTQGTHEYRASYDFMLEHAWVYNCPDGPLERRLFMSFTYSEMTFVNGVMTESKTGKAVFHYTFPPQ